MNRTIKPALCLALTAGIALAASSATASIANRYTFDNNANDSVGGQNGTVLVVKPGGVATGTLPSFDGSQVTMQGDGGYIDLPNGLLSSKTNVTLEFWMTWNGTGDWERLFDFGSIGILEGGVITTNHVEDTDGTWRNVANVVGQNTLFITPSFGGSGGRMRFAASDAWWTAERPVLDDALPVFKGTEAHIVVTYGQGGARMFYDGIQTGSQFVENFIPLTNIVDVNNWLGRAQYNDPMFAGSINEFRIHDTLLTAQEIQANYFAGANTPGPNNPGAPQSLTMSGLSTSMQVGEVQTPQLYASFANIGGLDVYSQDLTSLTSSATNVIVIDISGRVKAVGPGNATVTATLTGVPAQSVTINVSQGAPQLVNRYSFSGNANDSVGGQNGTVVPPLAGGAALSFTNGQLDFPGGGWATAAYVDLPDSLISVRTNVTIEAWFTWRGPSGSDWQRVFDFGSSLKGTDPRNPGNGLGYLMLTPRRGGGGMRAEARSEAPHTSANLDAPASSLTPLNQQIHVAMVYAPKSAFSRLYVNGLPVSTQGTPFELNTLTDNNNWLGVAQWQDPALNGLINELRIHEGTLSDLDVAFSLNTGPDALPQDPGNLKSVKVNPVQLLYGNTTAGRAYLLSNWDTYTNVDITGISGVTLQSQNTNLFTVSGVGVLTPTTNLANIGSAGLKGTYQGLASTGLVQVLAPVSLSITNATQFLEEGAPATFSLLATFPGSETNGYANVNVSAFTGVTRTSSNTNVATISTAGVVTPRSPGVSTLTSTYGGLTNQTVVTVTTPPDYVPGTLIHRYSFSEAADTTTVNDSVGAAHGTVVGLLAGSANDNFTGTGQLAVSGTGTSGTPGSAYVNLPNGLISSLQAVTMEGWVTRRDDDANQRYFDFGISTGATNASGEYIEDSVNGGWRYFFLSPNSGGFRTALTPAGGGAAENPSLVSSVGANFGLNTSTHYAVVYDPGHGVARIYVNGNWTGSAAASLSLTNVDDRNNWIGRAQWSGDNMLNALVDEFRIWNGPLLAADIAANYAAGPNTVVVPVVRPKLTVKLVPPNAVITWSASATGFNLEASDALGTGASWSGTGLPAPIVVDGQNQVTLPSSAADRYFRLKK